jgi:hypothetical protein
MKVRIYTPPNAAKYAQFALNVTARILEHYSTIWDFPVNKQLEKLDQICVPSIQVPFACIAFMFHPRQTNLHPRLVPANTLMKDLHGTCKVLMF